MILWKDEDKLRTSGITKIPLEQESDRHQPAIADSYSMRFMCSLKLKVWRCKGTLWNTFLWDLEDSNFIWILWQGTKSLASTFISSQTEKHLCLHIFNYLPSLPGTLMKLYEIWHMLQGLALFSSHLNIHGSDIPDLGDEGNSKSQQSTRMTCMRKTKLKHESIQIGHQDHQVI